MKSLLTLNKYLWNYKGRLFLGCLFIILSNLFDLLKIIYIGDVVKVLQENLISNENASLLDAKKDLLKFGGIAILMALTSGVFRYAMRQTIIVTSRLVEYDLKNTIFDHFQSLSLKFYKKNKIGDLINRISEDVSHVRMYLGPGIMYTINLVTLFAIYFSYMFSQNAELTAYTIIPLLLLSLLIYKVSSIMNRKSKEVQEKQSILSAFVQDVFSGIRIVKSYNNEGIKTAEYYKKTAEYRRKSLSLAKTNAYFFPLMILLIGVSYVVILYNGGNQYINGEIKDISILVEFFMFVGALAWPFTAIGWVTSIVQRAAASQDRINELLDEKSEIETGMIKPDNIEGNIVFKDVSFTYDNTGIQALKNISFELRSGETLAIIGKTGSGKSTLVELIARLYDPNQGEILIDGLALSQWDISSLRKSIGFVPQESFLFSDTIGNNINFSNDFYDRTLVGNAAENAAIAENINAFAKGYETRVGERGITLSGGQKQRVSIARALMKNPKILIFDDSLSAVDTSTEEKILQNLHKETDNKTCIIISHRISSSIGADKIIVLDEGRIAEMGKHEDLLAKKGLYEELYQLQLKREYN